MKSLSQSSVFVALIGCFTLGLAPYLPEPHLVGKIWWIAGGARGMAFEDYFDFVLHATPWVWLLFLMSKRGIDYFFTK